VAKVGEAAKRNGKTRWEAVRKLQRVCGPSAVRKEDGRLTQVRVNLRFCAGGISILVSY